MNTFSQTRRWAAFALALFLCLSSLADSTAQKDDKKKEPAPQGTPVLWQDPGDVSARDLLAGPGPEMKPDLSSVTFVKDEVGGYSPKFRVTDGAGKTWVAKFGKEAQPETAAVSGCASLPNFATHVLPAPSVTRNFGE